MNIISRKITTIIRVPNCKIIYYTNYTSFAVQFLQRYFEMLKELNIPSLIVVEGSVTSWSIWCPKRITISGQKYSKITSNLFKYYRTIPNFKSLTETLVEQWNFDQVNIANILIKNDYLMSLLRFLYFHLWFSRYI